MDDSLKQDLIKRLKQVGAYDVCVADPKQGFDRALPKQHPLQLWERCRSVVVFAVAMGPQTNNVYMGPYAPWKGPRELSPVPQDIQSEEYAMDRLSRLFVSSITLKGMIFLSEKGYEVSFTIPQLKLSAYEAGLGVYGRSGLILHPELGNRMSLGAILTNAALEPDGRLEGFHPCEKCNRCVEMCPAHAFDPEKEYPQSWSRSACTTKREEIAQKRLFCHNCFAVCPAGKIDDDMLLSMKAARSLFKKHRIRISYSVERGASSDKQ